MTRIIAEIGTSHEGNLEKAKRLIDTAKNAGASAVKFQWVYAAEILHPKTGFVELPGGKIPLYERFKQLECKAAFYEATKEYAHKAGLLWGASPFGLKSLRELLEVGTDFIKIASPELNHLPLLKELSALRKDKLVILSSGVSKMCDIERALEIVGRENVELLHCITCYPAPEEEYNLSLIKTLSAITGVKTGVSDHSTGAVLVPVLSTALGASSIEKHITLSRDGEGLDDKVALDGNLFKKMCENVRNAEMDDYKTNLEKLESLFGQEKVKAVLGDGVKRLSKSEMQNYGRTNRSLHFMRAMKKGETIREKDIGVLRTEKILSVGLHPEMLENVIGSVMAQDAADGEGVAFNHLVEKSLTL